MEDVQHLSARYVDRKRALVYVTRSDCRNCGESTISFNEMSRADGQVREARKKLSGKVLLRMDPTLHGLIRGRSLQTERSLNEEILYLLEKALGVDEEDLQGEPWKGSPKPRAE